MKKPYIIQQLALIGIVVFLSGCGPELIAYEVAATVINEVSTKKSNWSSELIEIREYSDEQVCNMATKNGNWQTRESELYKVREAKRRGLGCGVLEKKFATWSDERLCVLAEHNGDWTKGDKYVEYIIEAKRRGLGCGVVIKTETEVSSGNYSNSDICGIAWSPFDKQWKTAKHIQQYVQEAKRRGLDCVVEEELPTQVATKNTPTVSSNKNSFITPLINNDGLSKLSDWVICYQATDKGNWTKHSAGLYYIEEAKRRGLGCGVEGEDQLKLPLTTPLHQ